MCKGEATSKASRSAHHVDVAHSPMDMAAELCTAAARRLENPANDPGALAAELEHMAMQMKAAARQKERQARHVLLAGCPNKTGSSLKATEQCRKTSLVGQAGNGSNIRSNCWNPAALDPYAPGQPPLASMDLLRSHLQKKASIPAPEKRRGNPSTKLATIPEQNHVVEDNKASGVIGNTRLTTIQLRNLPKQYTLDMVVELLDSKRFAGRYDFVYLPLDFQTWESFGYAVVNLLTEADAECARAVFHGFKSWTIPNQKVCKVCWSDSQGLHENTQRFRNNAAMHKLVPEHVKPAVFDAGVWRPLESNHQLCKLSSLGGNGVEVARSAESSSPMFVGLLCSMFSETSGGDAPSYNTDTPLFVDPTSVGSSGNSDVDGLGYDPGMPLVIEAEGVLRTL